MDDVVDNHAYRCLPLAIANSHAWEVLAPFALSAEWNGDDHPQGLALRRDDGAPPPTHKVASHFGYGIVEGIDDSKLDIAFDKAGRKKVLDSFVEPSK